MAPTADHHFFTIPLCHHLLLYNANLPPWDDTTSLEDPGTCRRCLQGSDAGSTIECSLHCLRFEGRTHLRLPFYFHHFNSQIYVAVTATSAHPQPFSIHNPHREPSTYLRLRMTRVFPRARSQQLQLAWVAFIAGLKGINLSFGPFH
eukprot:2501083-Amphidinium_carterae.1